VEQPGPGAEVRVERKKARQASVSRLPAEKPRRAAAKGPRREAAPSEGVSPAGDAGREPSIDRAETAGRESASRQAEQLESGEVIDWILKKRAGQK